MSLNISHKRKKSDTTEQAEGDEENDLADFTEESQRTLFKQKSSFVSSSNISDSKKVKNAKGIISKKKRVDSRKAAELNDFPLPYIAKKVKDVEDSLLAPDIDLNGKPFLDRRGCRIAPKSMQKSNGYGQVHLSAKSVSDSKESIGKQAKIGHLYAYHYDRKLVNPNKEHWSHLCGRGADGCCLRAHGPIEPKEVNYERKNQHCEEPVECGRCAFRFHLNPCNGHTYKGVNYPPCIRGTFLPYSELQVDEKKKVITRMQETVAQLQNEIATLQASLQ